MIRSVPKASSCLMYSRGEIQAHRQLAVLAHIGRPARFLTFLRDMGSSLARRWPGEPYYLLLAHLCQLKK